MLPIEIIEKDHYGNGDNITVIYCNIYSILNARYNTINQRNTKQVQLKITFFVP